jgi:hypothetical protein
MDGENGGRYIVKKVTECRSCKQDSSQYDRDLLPEKEIRLRWRVWKQQRAEPDDPPGGFWYRVGNECQVCYETRRRYFGASLAEMDEERKKPEILDDFTNKRRMRAREEDKNQKKEGPMTYMTSKKASQYTDKFVEGTFVKLDTLIADKTDFDPKKMSLERKLDLVKNVLNMIPIKGEFGNWGVELFDQKPGNYRFKRGLKSSTDIERSEHHDNEEQQQVSAAEAMSSDAVHPFSFGQGGQSARLAASGTGSSAASSDCLDLDYAPPTKKLRFDACDEVTEVDVKSEHESSTVASSAGGIPRSASPCASRRSSISSRSVKSKTGTEAAEAGDAEGSDDEADAAAAEWKRNRPSSKKPRARAASQLKLRSTSSSAVVELSRNLVKETEHNYSAQRLWDTKWKTRDLQNATARLTTAATKVSHIADSSGETQDLSGKLLDLAENIGSRGKIFTKLRERPMELINSLDEEARDSFSSWPMSLSVNIFSSVGASLASRVDLASVRATIRLSKVSDLQLADYSWELASHDFNNLNFGLLMVDGMRKSADTVEVASQVAMLQATIVATMAEKQLRMTNFTGFVALWDDLVADGLVPDSVSLIPFSEKKPETLTFIGGWAWQAAADISSLMVASQLLKCKLQNRAPSAKLRGVARQMMANRSSLSVRIRAACGPRSTGCQNQIVGKIMWDMVTSIHSQGLNFEQARETCIALWKEKVNTLPELSTEVSVAADQISDWYEQDGGICDTINKLCMAFEDLESEDDEIKGLKDEAAKLRDQLLSAVEAVIDDADECDTFLSNRIAACHDDQDQNDAAVSKEILHQESEFRWLSAILPVVMKLSSLAPSSCSAALKEVVIRCNLLDDAFRAEDEFLKASSVSEGLSIDVATAFIKRAAKHWQEWTRVTEAPIMQAENENAVQRWLLKGLRPRPMQDIIIRVVKACAAMSAIFERVVSVATELKEMLPAQVGVLIQSYTKWGLIRSVSQKLKQCKSVGQIELAHAANNVHVMKGSFVGGVSAEEFQELCDEVSTGYSKAMECFIKKNGSMNEGAVKSWILKFNPIDEAVQKWDFSDLTWVGKGDDHEDTKGIQKEVSVMESIVFNASTRAREVEGILDFTAWDTTATVDLKKVLASLTYIASEAKTIKKLLGLLVITDVLCREPKPPTQARDIDHAILYIREKLGIKDLAMLSEGLPARLSLPPPPEQMKQKAKAAAAEPTVPKRRIQRFGR